MKRILIVSVNWFGDAIMTTPALKAIKEKFPSSFLAIMAPERVKDVFSNNPYVDEVIIFDEKKNHRSFRSKINFIKQLKAKKLDAVFLIHRSLTRALICYFSGIKTRIGYKRLKNTLIINKAIAAPSKNIHKQDYYLCLFEKAGIEIADKLPRIYADGALFEKYKNEIAAIRENHTYVAGINPSANWLLKRWPAKNFALLCDRLIKELNCAVVITGAAADIPVAEEVAAAMKEKAYNFCGKTNIKELAAIISNLDLFISNDSGPAHLAGSLGTNTLVLFGPTSPELSSPRGRCVDIIKKSVNCKIPCYNLACADNICMKNITIEDVFLRAKAILEKCLKT